MITATRRPTTTAASTARIQLPVRKLTYTAIKALISIIPSTPTFSIFACWVITAEKAASSIGVEALIVACIIE